MFGDLPLPPLSEYVDELSELDRLLLRVALANTARPPLLVVGDIEQVTSDRSRDLLVARLIELGREDDAIPWLRRAIDAPRYEARQFPHVNLARIYEKKGQVLEAVAEYGRALDKMPSYAPAVAGLRRLQGRVN